MATDRRTFLTHCGIAGASLSMHAVGVPRRSNRHFSTSLVYSPAASIEPGDPPDAASMRALGARAVEAAIAAGAAYADVRLTHQLIETVGTQPNVASAGERSQEERIRIERELVYRSGPLARTFSLTVGIGVRAFFNGYWGFASSPYWSADDAAWLGQEAAGEAKTNAAVGLPRDAQLGVVPIVRNGEYRQAGIDPFTVPTDEKVYTFQTLLEMVYQDDRNMNVRIVGHRSVNWSYRGTREQRVFVSSEGTSTAQLRFTTGVGDLEVYGASTARHRFGKSWEELRNPDFFKRMPQLIAEAKQRNVERTESVAQAKPVDVGRYDIVFGNGTTAALLYETLGAATELDRALGFEANAGGTSFLGPDPLEWLGSPVCSPLVNVTANRDAVNGAATVKWDDEGIETHTFPLIRNGILVDYQTTREQAGWLRSYYQKTEQPVRSHACASSASALDVPIQTIPNLTLEPGAHDILEDDLIRDTKRGIYFWSGSIEVDQQRRNGSLRYNPRFPPREIINGRLGATIQNVGILFNSTELWKKKLIALGGARSAGEGDLLQTKGQPEQQASATIRAVPMKVTQMTVYDVTRKG